jgi:hypothetical protein
MRQRQLCIAEQLKGQVKSFNSLTLVVGILGAETEHPRFQPLQVLEMIPKPA